MKRKAERRVNTDTLLALRGARSRSLLNSTRERLREAAERRRDKPDKRGLLKRLLGLK